MPGFRLLLIIALLLGGCASAPKTEDWDARQYYEEGRRALLGEDYTSAIDNFEKLETRYPFGNYTQLALLNAAYAYYKSNNPESAIATADRFIKLYPTHPHADYAYYLRGLAHFYSRDSFLDEAFKQDPARRDSAPVRRSFQYFAELIRRYPDSRYVADARQRMIFLRNELARHEAYAADYYLRRGAYVAAANRAKYVLEHYPRTPAVSQALSALAESYDRMGIADLAQDTRRVIALNYPAAAREARPGAAGQ